MIAKAVTVELTTKSLKILLATNVGRLSLILRQTAEKASPVKGSQIVTCSPASEARAATRRGLLPRPSS